MSPDPSIVALSGVLFVLVLHLHRPDRRPPGRARPRRWAPVRAERGQGTVEYALVLLGAAAVALALVAWVARTGAVGRLFDAVVGRILSQA